LEELHSLAASVEQEMQLILDKMLVFLVAMVEMQVLLAPAELLEPQVVRVAVALLATQELLETQVHLEVQEAEVEAAVSVLVT
jgi:hypothetical protein